MMAMAANPTTQIVVNTQDQKMKVNTQDQQKCFSFCVCTLDFLLLFFSLFCLAREGLILTLFYHQFYPLRWRQGSVRQITNVWGENYRQTQAGSCSVCSDSFCARFKNEERTSHLTCCLLLPLLVFPL